MFSLILEEYFSKSDHLRSLGLWIPEPVLLDWRKLELVLAPLLWLLPMPSPNLDSASNFRNDPRCSHTTHKPPSLDKEVRLDNLLPELLYMIYSSIHSLQDAVCLSITCKRLCLIGAERVQTLRTLMAAPWAGDRLICINHGVKTDDMPEGLLTEEEEKRIVDNGVDGPGWDLYEYYQGLDWEVRFCEPKEIWSCGHDVSFVGGLPENDMKRYWYLAGAPSPRHIADPDPIIGERLLCNLSKREYIRHKMVEEYGRAGFGHFLISRICWSSRRSPNMDDGRDIHRGVWAGDRFEITTREMLKGKSEDWKDVGREMLQTMIAIQRPAETDGGA